MPSISVVIPVYNKQQWIRECLESIRSQTFTDYEVIIVDDGSTDGSAAICDEAAAGDDRIRVIHQVNSGVSAARNRGMDEVTAPWVAFVDGDDTIAPDYLQHLYEHAHGCDIVSDSIGGEVVDYVGCNIADYVDTVGRSQLGTSVWGKLYSRELLVGSGVRFDSRWSFGEDTMFNLTLWLYCRHIRLIPHDEYRYRMAGANRYGFTIDDLRDKIQALKYGYQAVSAKFGRQLLVERDINITISLYPLQRIMEEGESPYRDFYFENYPEATEMQFYNDPRCSPIIRLITEAKTAAAERRITDARQLLLYAVKTYSDRLSRIDYPYKSHKVIAWFLKVHLTLAAVWLLRIRP